MDNFNNQTGILVQQYYNKVAKPLLPNVEQGTGFAFGSQDSPFSIEISPNSVNGSLVASQYEYKAEKLRFIHYTKLKYAKDIIREGKFRMYSLSSMNDPQELSFALNEIIPDKSDFTINTYKDETFVLSMNEFEKGKESSSNWKDYGEGEKGIGIVIYFPKETQIKWFHHYLSRILYREEHLEALKQFHIKHTDFITEKNVTITGQVQHFMLPLAAFHKTNDWEKENEVRLIVTKNYVNNESIYKVKLDGDKKYIELVLNKKRFQVLLDNTFKNDTDSINWGNESYPIPKIEKIILGPKLIETAKLKAELKKLAKESLGYEIKVEKSKLIAL